MNEVRHHRIEISDAESGMRLDAALARRFAEYSRSALKTWIDAGRATLNDEPCRPRDPVQTGDEVAFTAVLDGGSELIAQAVAFDVVHADASCIVVDKPAGCVVHPGAGNPDTTLANGLVHRFPELTALPRAGLIHRLDKDTSGLLIVARTSAAYQTLNRAMAERRISRHYDAIANGRIISGGSIDAPIGRDPVKRTRMSVRNGGRDALTHYRVAARYRAHTRLDVQLETGRTHQIRVHMAYIGHPLLGDTSYGARVMLPADPAADLERCVRGFARPALHARRLEFAHPDSGEHCVFHSDWPDDFTELVRACADDAARPAA